MLPTAGKSPSIALNLLGDRASFTARFFDPRTGQYEPPSSVAGGTILVFKAPDAGDWVLHLTAPAARLGAKVGC